MNDITITRWARYGHERGYATAPDGTKLGWIDVKTGAVTLEPDAVSDADAGTVAAALVAWAGGGAASSGEPPSQPAPSVPDAQTVPALTPETPELDPAAQPPVSAEPAVERPEASEPEWRDLALNTPGQSLREKAQRAWEVEKRAGTFIAYLARAVNADTEERAWRRGIEGEEVVGAALEKVTRHGWKVLHSIPFGKDSDIDHLAIGPGGVVLINTKCHKGAAISVRRGGIYVNGAQTQHVLQVRAQVKRAAKALSAALGGPVRIQGCVAIHNGGLMEPEIKFAHHFDDVWVVTRWNIARVLRKEEPTLTPEQVEAIFEVARRSDTWV